jgi:hypothetical protein
MCNLEFIEDLDKIQEENNFMLYVTSSDKIKVKFFVCLLAPRNDGLRRNVIVDTQNLNLSTRCWYINSQLHSLADFSRSTPSTGD